MRRPPPAALSKRESDQRERLAHASGDGFTPGDAAYVRKLRATLARFGYTKLG